MSIVAKQSIEVEKLWLEYMQDETVKMIRDQIELIVKAAVPICVVNEIGEYEVRLDYETKKRITHWQNQLKAYQQSRYPELFNQ